MKVAPRSSNRTFIEFQKFASASAQPQPPSHLVGQPLYQSQSCFDWEALMTCSFFKVMFGNVSMLLHADDHHLFYFICIESPSMNIHNSFNHPTVGGHLGVSSIDCYKYVYTCLMVY